MAWGYLVPDASVNPSKGRTASLKKISAGKDLHFGLAVENISEFDFDAFVVKYWLTDNEGNVQQEQELE